MLTDVPTPFLGTPFVPLKSVAGGGSGDRPTWLPLRFASASGLLGCDRLGPIFVVLIHCLNARGSERERERGRGGGERERERGRQSHLNKA